MKDDEKLAADEARRIVALVVYIRLHLAANGLVRLFVHRKTKV